jgi:hypothetical protein
VFIDLYPTKITVQRKNADGLPDDKSTIELVIPSTQSVYEQALPLIQAAMGGHPIYFIWYKFNGLWVKFQPNTHLSLAEGFIVTDEGDGEKAPVDKTWETLVIGDRVDVQRAPGMWVSGRITIKDDTYVNVQLDKENKIERFNKDS